MALTPKPNKKPPIVRDTGTRKIRKVTINTRYQEFVDGTLTIDDLDDEEIMRGQLRTVAGDFRGRPPAYVPISFAKAIAEKQRQMVFVELGRKVLKALNTLDEVMSRQHPQPGDNARVAAARLVLEYNIGKVPDKVELKAEISTWEQNVGELIVHYPKAAEKNKEIESSDATE